MSISTEDVWQREYNDVLETRCTFQVANNVTFVKLSQMHFLLITEQLLF